MDMEVKNRLAGGGTAVDADVIAVGSLVFLDDRLGFIGGLDKRYLLCDRGVAPCRNVRLRDEERVAGRYGEGVPQAKHLIATEKRLDPLMGYRMDSMAD